MTDFNQKSRFRTWKDWTRWEIGQSGFAEAADQPIYYYVKFNGREIYRTQNFNPIIKRRLDVYAGDDIYPAADGSMRYLMYRIECEI